MYELQPISCNWLSITHSFKPHVCTSCNRTESSRLFWHPCPFKPHVCTSCNIYKINSVQQQVSVLSSRTYVRVATAKSNKTCSSCTDYYVHLNLFECFTSIDIQCLTVTFSISGWESTLNAVRTSALHQLFGIVRF